MVSWLTWYPPATRKTCCGPLPCTRQSTGLILVAPVATAAPLDVTVEIAVAVEDVVVAVVVVLVAVDVEVEVGEVVENVPVVLVQVMMADPSNSWNRTASASAEMP
mmetsp:Transcript_5908/g.22466  ORF Transcript_5908/g.22466 Transcript_5908/m.22466 type:complete len:106 (+) Transcript_5908:922-1239(+)